MQLSDQQKEHRASVLQKISIDQHKRYEAGAKKYGTYLPDMSINDLANNALEETYDNTTYTITLIQKLKDLSTWKDIELIELRDRINYELERRSQEEMMETL